MAHLYEAKDAVKTNQLREAFGEHVVLFDEQQESVTYQIVAEFSLGQNSYAVLQSEELRKEDEVAIFKVNQKGDSELELETIEDDDEWDNVAEIYDEMVFPEQDGF